MREWIKRNENPWTKFSKYVDVRDKEDVVNILNFNMLSKTLRMFKYNGLPETIPQRFLELFLQTHGHICFARHDDALYIYAGNFGGKPTVYYIPEEYIVANGPQHFSANLKIDEECVVMANDSMYLGLMPMNNIYASQIADNLSSIKVANINSRIVSIITANTDDDKTAADVFIKNIENGELSAILSDDFAEGFSAIPYAAKGADLIQQLIELHQYLRGTWYQELGLSAVFNMKREALSENEVNASDEILFPLIDDMLKCRREALEKVNAMFGTDITVELDSSWYKNHKKDEIQLEMEEELEEELENENELLEVQIENEDNIENTEVEIKEEEVDEDETLSD